MSKFYKVTNKDETHCSGIYHDGLNQCFLPFTPEGEERESVGIYFTDRKNVMKMFDSEFGYWIREVTIPDGEEVYIVANSNSPEKYVTRRVILGERKRWSDPAVFQSLLNDGCDLTADYNYILQYATEHNLIEIVKLLLSDSRVDPNYFGYDGVTITTIASMKGYIDLVKMLLTWERDGKYIDPTLDDNETIGWASCNGHIEIVKLLLAWERDGKRIDPSKPHHKAIRWAARKGRTEIVKLLKKYYEEHGLTIPDWVL